jgi:hypothetical protein
VDQDVDRQSMSIFILKMPFAIKNLFSFPLSPAKLISDYFDIKKCGSNKTFLLTTHQFICAPNLWSVEEMQPKQEKNGSRCEFGPHRH